MKLPVDRIGTHLTHCCFIHGCKYGDEDCPVSTGEREQEFLCEECDADGIKSVEEIQAMKTLRIKSVQNVVIIIRPMNSQIQGSKQAAGWWNW